MLECSHMLYNLKDKITVVISSDDDIDNISTLLDDISNQYYSNGLNIFVVNKDGSDEFERVIQKENNKFPKLKISVIKPKCIIEARKNDVSCCDTPYVFFMESNTRLFSKWTLFNSTVWLNQKRKKVFCCRIAYRSKSALVKLTNMFFNWLHRFWITHQPFTKNSYFCVSYDDFMHFGKFDGNGGNHKFEFSNKFTPNNLYLLEGSVDGDGKLFKKVGYWKELAYIFKDVSHKPHVGDFIE